MNVFLFITLFFINAFSACVYMIDVEGSSRFYESPLKMLTDNTKLTKIGFVIGFIGTTIAVSIHLVGLTFYKIRNSEWNRT